jgi:hypothetical protein
MRVAILGLACLVVASLCSAQTYDLKVYQAGASAPQQSYPLTNAVCDQADPGAGSTTNPTKVVWADPDRAGRACLYVGSATDPIFSRPIGSYEGTLTITTLAGTSAESARAPFTVAPRPAAPTGLHFSQ